MWPTSLFALVTDDHMHTSKTGRLVARFTVDTVFLFTLTTESRLAHFAVVYALEAEILVALVAEDYIIALKAGRLAAFFTVESALTLTTAELSFARSAVVESFAVGAESLVAIFTEEIVFAAFAECRVAIVTDDHICALTTGRRVARFTVVTVFAFITECRFAHFAPAPLFAVVAEYLLALSTVKRFFTMITQ
jgi:hypothetical protein